MVGVSVGLIQSGVCPSTKAGIGVGGGEGRDVLREEER